MLVTVIGTRKLDFKSQDGKEIKGIKIFVEYDASGDNTEGKIADSVFIPASSNVIVPAFKFGEQYDFVYEASGLGGRSRLTKILTADGKEVKSNPFANLPI